MALTRQKVLALAKKKWGKEVYLTYNRAAPDPETRRILRAELDKLKDAEPKPPPPTPEQEAYRKAWKAWKESKDRLDWEALEPFRQAYNGRLNYRQQQMLLAQVIQYITTHRGTVE